MTQLSLIPLSPLINSKNRRLLLDSIKRKRTALKKIIVRNEILKVRLDMLKREYMVKIGSLVVKDNHLDLEIMRLRNLLHLIKEGMTYLEAVEELKSTFYAEQLEIEKEEESIRNAERILENSHKSKINNTDENIKKIWKHLIGIFHPDLTQDPVEKKKREEIMIQINLAYEEGDLLRLHRIEHEQTVSDESPNEKLENILVLIEDEIIEQEKNYVMMKESEWYKWDQKILKTSTTIGDIFSDTERRLLDDIVVKIEIVRELKKEIELLNK